MASCCVINCSSKKATDSSVILFSLPEHLSRDWVEVINRPDWQPKKRSVMCNKHFAKSDYCVVAKRLVPGATPLRSEALVDVNSGAFAYIFIAWWTYKSQKFPPNFSDNDEVRNICRPIWGTPEKPNLWSIWSLWTELWGLEISTSRLKFVQLVLGMRL